MRFMHSRGVWRPLIGHLLFRPLPIFPISYLYSAKVDAVCSQNFNPNMQLKECLTTMFSSPETEFTSALVSHLYGVFPTHGFPNDTFFPSTYSIGEVVLENSGCAVNNKVCNTIKCFDLAKN